ncbi:MAG: magnesium transporter [Gammaproteobacteria bacterium]|jgi:magnesium transporter
MAETEIRTKTEHLLEHLASVFEEGAIRSGALDAVRSMLNALHPAEIAHLLETLPPARRELVWELVDSENDGEVLVHLGDEIRASLIREMDTEELLSAIRDLDLDDLADFIQDLPAQVMAETLEAMDKQDRHRLESVLSYPEDSAGGLMNTDTITVRANVTLDVVLRYLRRHGELPEATDNLIVVNRFDKYLGILPLSVLVASELDNTVAEVMNQGIEPIPADMKAGGVAKRFEDLDLITAPVVDENGRLLGRITIDDVVDLIREEAEHAAVTPMTGPTEEDLFAPIWPSTRRRAVWLGINLATAFLASWVIGRFEGALQQLVTLAVLMPIVASMGGIAGTQTMTVVIRAQALGQVASSSLRWLFLKEISVSLLNGLLWALVVALIAVWWFGNDQIGGIIALAMIINLLNAGLVGMVLPLIMRRMGIDPAVAGATILTTFTDVVGYASFLGLATLLIVRHHT